MKKYKLWNNGPIITNYTIFGKKKVRGTQIYHQMLSMINLKGLKSSKRGANCKIYPKMTFKWPLCDLKRSRSHFLVKWMVLLDSGCQNLLETIPFLERKKSKKKQIYPKKIVIINLIDIKSPKSGANCKIYSKMTFKWALCDPKRSRSHFWSNGWFYWTQEAKTYRKTGIYYNSRNLSFFWKIS